MRFGYAIQIQGEKMTETKVTTDKADDLIEIVTNQIPASTLIAVLVIGALVGAGVVLLWAYSEMQREGVNNGNSRSTEI